MRPHNENWIAQRYDVKMPDDDRLRGIMGGAQGEARARLASYAPEMARMLLALAGGDGDPYCQGCGQLDEVRKHAKDCDLWRVLCSAGVVQGSAVLVAVK